MTLPGLAAASKKLELFLRVFGVGTGVEGGVFPCDQLRNDPVDFFFCLLGVVVLPRLDHVDAGF